MNTNPASVRRAIAWSVGSAAVLTCLWVGLTREAGATAAASCGSRLQLAAHAGAAATASSAAASLQSTGDRPGAVLAMHAVVKS